MSIVKRGTTDEIRFNVRVPVDLHQRVTARAASNGRSMNSEIVSILELVLGDIEAQRIDQLRAKLAVTNDRLRATAQQIDEIAQEKQLIEQEIAVREAMIKKDDTLFQRLAKLSGEDSSPVEAKAKKG